MSLSDFPYDSRYPKKFQRLPGWVNIARLTGEQRPGTTNDYRCCEEQCGWAAVGANESSAKLHARSAHKGRRCHVFQPIERDDLVTCYRAKRLEVQRDYRAKVKTQQVATTARQSAQGHEDEDDDDDDDDNDEFEPAYVRVATVNERQSTTGTVLGVVCMIHEGQGDCQVLSAHEVDEDMREAMQVAATWVSSQAAALCRWLGLDAVVRQKKVLLRVDQTVSVLLSTRGVHKGGISLAAGVAVSLVSTLVQRLPLPQVAVTGVLDLQGNMLEVSGVEGKLWGCMAKNMDLLVVPQCVYDKLSIDSLPEDLQAYARRVLRGAAHMRDVLPLIMEDCPPLPASVSSPRRLEPTVGVAYGLRYGAVENPLRFTVQALFRSGGQGRVLLTGFGTCDLMVSCAKDAWAWARAHFSKFQPPQPRAVDLRLRGRDIHLHMVDGCNPGGLDVYTSVMAVACLSLLSGRPAREDVAVSGYVTIHDLLGHERLAVGTAEDVDRLERQGFRKLIVGHQSCVKTEVLREAMRQKGISLVVGTKEDLSWMGTFSSLVSRHVLLPSA